MAPASVSPDSVFWNRTFSPPHTPSRNESIHSSSSILASGPRSRSTTSLPTSPSGSRKRKGFPKLGKGIALPSLSPGRVGSRHRKDSFTRPLMSGLRHKKKLLPVPASFLKMSQNVTRMLTVATGIRSISKSASVSLPQLAGTAELTSPELKSLPMPNSPGSSLTHHDVNRQAMTSTDDLEMQRILHPYMDVDHVHTDDNEDMDVEGKADGPDSFDIRRVQAGGSDTPQPLTSLTNSPEVDMEVRLRRREKLLDRLGPEADVAVSMKLGIHI